jgi:hypothetical protein
MIYDARAAAALSLFKREGLPVEVLDQLHWRIRRLPLSSRWRLIAAISSGPQRAIGDAPAMEAVGLGD